MMNEIMNDDEIDRLCMESDADYEFLRQDMLDMYRMRVSGTMHRFPPACVPFDSVSYAYEAMSRLKAKAALLNSDDDEEEYDEEDDEEDARLTLCRLNKEAAILRSSLRADAVAVTAVSGLEIPVLRRANTYIGDGLTNGNPCGDRLYGEPVADLVADIVADLDFADYPFEWDINMWLDEDCNVVNQPLINL